MITVTPLMVFLCACQSPEVELEQPFQDAPAFSVMDGARQPEKWWTVFGDRELDAQVEQALAQNLTLAAAWQRLEAAGALVRRESAALLPELDGTASAAYQDPLNREGDTDFQLGLEASYEVDLWGRIDALVEAEEQRARASLEDYQTAALTLSAEVTLAWFQLLEARQQRTLLLEQIENNEKILTVLNARFASGQIRSADVLRQRQLIEATREQLFGVETQIGLFAHLLRVLQGQPPQGGPEYPDVPLPVIPALPATGLPSELVQRRPDVRSAFHLLHAENAELAAAVADQYPRVSLTASLTTSTDAPERLFETWAGSVAGQLVAPLFDGGRRDAEVSRREALVREQFSTYAQRVIDAFQEVEDALLRERQQLKIVSSVERQLEINGSVNQQLRVQYLNGGTDYLSLLSSLTEGQRLQRALLSARLDLLRARVSLYRALAGGLETPELPAMLVSDN